MDNVKSIVSPIAILIGIIALALGIYLLMTNKYIALHPLRAYAAIGVGIVLLIAGIATMIMNRGKSTASSN